MYLPPLQLGVEALKERYLRHVHAPTRPQGERTMQLSIIRKDSTPSGQEELHTESVAVTVKEGAEEPAATKPGMGVHIEDGASGKLQEFDGCASDRRTRLLTSCPPFHRREAAHSEAAPAVRHGPAETGGEGTQGRADSPRQ